MKLSIYQSYYQNGQRIELDAKSFIPFDNTKNVEPQMREYPLHLQLYEKHKEEQDAYWGLVSWKWSFKMRATGNFFVNWIKKNPSYDLYFIDPHIVNAAAFKNSFIDGDISHPGLLTFSQKLIDELGLKIDLKRDGYNPNLFSTCTFWVGNVNFWNAWYEFWNRCLSIVESNPAMKRYMFGYGLKTHLGQWVINFPFIHERFISIFLYSQSNLKWIQYPYDSPVFYNKVVQDNEHGGESGALVFYKLMYLLNKKTIHCNNKLIVPMSDKEFGHKSNTRTPDGLV